MAMKIKERWEEWFGPRPQHSEAEEAVRRADVQKSEASRLASALAQMRRENHFYQRVRKALDAERRNTRDALG